MSDVFLYDVWKIQKLEARLEVSRIELADLRAKNAELTRQLESARRIAVALEQELAAIREEYVVFCDDRGAEWQEADQ